jgi:hypothetical protein
LKSSQCHQCQSTLHNEQSACYLQLRFSALTSSPLQLLPLYLQDTPQAPGHVRSVSLGSSASQFLQSLKLQDPAALQHSLQAAADQLALPDQHTPHAEGSAVDVHAVFAGKAAAVAAQDRSAGQSARSKRTHRSSNGRASKDAMQLDVSVPEQLSHGFTPLPAVVENSPFDDSERCAASSIFAAEACS